MVVGGRHRSRRSVVVVWGVSDAKCGRLQSIAVRGLGRRRCVRWQQWLKVAEAKGVGPVGGGRSLGRRRRGRRKRFWGEKINASDFSSNSSDFSFIYLFFLKSITMVHITKIESYNLGFYGPNIEVLLHSSISDIQVLSLLVLPTVIIGDKFERFVSWSVTL
jgi:hypothetical protein